MLSKKEIVDAIEENGSSDILFGGTHVGGWCIQQDPDEFADLCLCLQENINRAGTAGCYLGVGTAAGGTERLIADILGLKSITIIDDGQHKDFKVWQELNKPALIESGVEVFEHIGDSHDEAAEQFLQDQKKTYDIIGIDGDHSACGARMDWLLVEAYTRPGTLVWLHDINVKRVQDQGPFELWEKLKAKHEMVFETFANFGIGCVRIK